MTIVEHGNSVLTEHDLFAHCEAQESKSGLSSISTYSELQSPVFTATTILCDDQCTSVFI